MMMNANNAKNMWSVLKTNDEQSDVESDWENSSQLSDKSEEYECDRDVLDLPPSPPPQRARPALPCRLGGAPRFGPCLGDFLIPHPGSFLKAKAQIKPKLKVQEPVEVETKAPRTWHKKVQVPCGINDPQEKAAIQPPPRTWCKMMPVPCRINDPQVEKPKPKPKPREDDSGWETVKARGSGVENPRTKSFSKFKDPKEMAKTLTKTRMCNNAGHCTYGPRCKFAHTFSELRVAPCIFGDGCRKKTTCRGWHESSETHDDAKARIHRPSPKVDVVLKPRVVERVERVERVEPKSSVVDWHPEVESGAEKVVESSSSRHRHRHWCQKCNQKRIGPTKEICDNCAYNISNARKIRGAKKKVVVTEALVPDRIAQIIAAAEPKA